MKKIVLSIFAFAFSAAAMAFTADVSWTPSDPSNHSNYYLGYKVAGVPQPVVNTGSTATTAQLDITAGAGDQVDVAVSACTDESGVEVCGAWSPYSSFSAPLDGVPSGTWVVTNITIIQSPVTPPVLP